MANYSILKSFIWKYLERFSYQIIQFIVQIILARILFPEDYGIIAITTVYIAICNVFIQSGFNMSLVQRKDIVDEDYSSVFTVGLIISSILYIIIFFTSPLIASFYNIPILSITFRIISIILIINSLNSVQSAYLVRKFEYKKIFLSNFISIIISGLIGVILALNNFGIWSLVFQQIIYSLISTIVMYFIIDWKPKFLINIKRIKYLFSFGWKLLCSGLIDTVYNNIYELIIGKKINQTTLAFYSKAKQFPSLIMDNINSSISSVMLATLSRLQDNLVEIKNVLKKAIIVSSTILFPMMIGLMAIAEPLIQLLLTDKWLECVPYMQLLCLSFILMPIHTMNLQTMNSIGRSDLFLKVEIGKKIIAIIILIITIPFGIYAMILGQIFISFISAFINTIPSKKTINYGFLEQMKDIFPQLILSIFMGIIVYYIDFKLLSSLTIIILKCIIGLIIYLLLIIIFKPKGYQYILELFSHKIKKN